MEQHHYDDNAHKIPTDWEGVTAVIPNVGGWLEIELQPQQLDHIWKCIEQKGEVHNKTLVGHIDNSYKLEDIDNIFWKNTLSPLCDKYGDSFDNMGRHIPVEGKHPYYLNNWWVNYQKQHEFNQCQYGIQSPQCESSFLQLRFQSRQGRSSQFSTRKRQAKAIMPRGEAPKACSHRTR